MKPKTTPAISFDQYCNLHSVREDRKNTVAFYLELYHAHIGEAHQPLRPDQWQSVLDKIMVVQDEEVDYEEAAEMILKHFKTRYAEPCDYRLPHYISGLIKEMRYYETCY